MLTKENSPYAVLKYKGESKTFLKKGTERVVFFASPNDEYRVKDKRREGWVIIEVGGFDRPEFQRLGRDLKMDVVAEVADESGKEKGTSKARPSKGD